MYKFLWRLPYLKPLKLFRTGATQNVYYMKVPDFFNLWDLDSSKVRTIGPISDSKIAQGKQNASNSQFICPQTAQFASQTLLQK